MSREIRLPRGAHTVRFVEGNTADDVKRESSAGPARSENHGMYGSSMRENRESPPLPAEESKPRAAWGRSRP